MIFPDYAAGPCSAVAPNTFRISHFFLVPWASKALFGGRDDTGNAQFFLLGIQHPPGAL
jgi:hypothetical protein